MLIIMAKIILNEKGKSKDKIASLPFYLDWGRWRG
jgi:hypothetical protein